MCTTQAPGGRVHGRHLKKQLLLGVVEAHDDAVCGNHRRESTVEQARKKFRFVKSTKVSFDERWRLSDVFV